MPANRVVEVDEPANVRPGITRGLVGLEVDWPAIDAERRGRAFEMAVGAELVQQPGQVFYWRERNAEVDFVYNYRDRLYAIEVKSGRKKSAKGLEAFGAQFPTAKRVILTPDNFPAFSARPREFLQEIGL